MKHAFLVLLLVIAAIVLSAAPSITSAGGGPVTIPSNSWVNVTPAYVGAPDGGVLAPATYNVIGVYDPISQRTISFDRWVDPVRKGSIYANAVLAYDPGSNTTTVLKLNNWTILSAPTGDGTVPLPANDTDPTPIDRHPMGGFALDPNSNAIYLVNGANQSGRNYYPDHPHDTWKFSLSSRSWSKVADGSSGAHPPSDVGGFSGMIFDLPTRKLAYFIVDYPNGTHTWLLDPATNRWSLVPDHSSAKDVYISSAGMAYDSRRNLLVAYGGGYHSGSPPSTKLWSYSVSQNRWSALADAPVAAIGAEFAYDSQHDIFLAVVGQTTLIYNPRTNQWSLSAAALNRGPNQQRQNVTYNVAHDVFVYQGGNWETPVWSLFRYADGGPSGLAPPTAPTRLRVIR